ncbi:hypothetical protein [Variovorax sp. Sphag1AA]|uniref:hypothetical protein n=1 Tax=Variovorax sp. Sphag1AA TaxID=2587027 RepID=UPI001610B35B|nr:hypothetical protein [Variovorax sp. Sphag1AA]MBB3176532.1 hypothetical protein [Variovorax sp. Sphag1AA]
MHQIATLATRFRIAFSSPFVHRSRAADCGHVPYPLIVLRGVSQRETIRSRAAKVIAVTAIDFGIGIR